MSLFLKHVANAPWMDVARLLDGRPLVVLAPHPDDETLGCGALLHEAAQLGADCRVICVTDGRLSHANSRMWAVHLAEVRKAELVEAVHQLAPSAEVHWLGYPDSEAPSDQTVARQVASLIPQNALVLASWEGDPHADHQQVAQMARRVVAERPDLKLAFYPVWGRFTDQVVSAYRIVPSRDARKAKVRALACHRTQMTKLIYDDPKGFVMERWRQRHFLKHPEIIIAA